MKVPRHIIAAAIAEKTMHVVDEKLLAQEIAAYLLSEHRTSDIESILRDIMQYRIDHGILEAEVVTAHEITDKVKTDVKQLLRTAYPKADKIHLSTRIDPEIIGGLRVDMANEQLDMSLSAKLATFKRITG